MSDEIPYAQPFPWTDEQPRGYSTRSLRKRKFVGSGLAVLREESLGSDSKLGNVAKNILMNLFHQHGIELDGEMESDANKFEGIGLSDGLLRIRTPPNNKGTTNTAKKTGPEKKSFFLPLLKEITESGTGTVSTRQILGKVCLLLQPGTLPGIMDSKDMVLAALHFLSSKSQTNSSQMLHLPLIRPLQAYGDLERRNYEKVGDWKLEDIGEKILRTEEIFLSSPSSWEWQKRESFSLRLSEADEEALLMKGTVPLCAMASTKKTKGEGVKRRKAPVKKVKKETSADTNAATSIDDAPGSNEHVESILSDDPF
mmetsp:Transcript_23696/g.65777  ORF Transcript_23696/g.65777 Transcript_23696/m.65777 type:complete len:312 (+) Transcript_23696:137-1072(+)|eukprot:CAMPEP_0172364766 /NCGR_PEP_ID=MMETSP1060-20121228/7820_1 /TAXON_ID=37318 /ORGANISM="Pseudo-nitzschia pungens, Strain cf. cingulata" /LENGTH=311 /DNA_ID=CAMNT_0013087843 /DNA_START=105 /DNA_END=1040 /DNA_ORIENTATION=+